MGTRISALGLLAASSVAGCWLVAGTGDFSEETATVQGGHAGAGLGSGASGGIGASGGTTSSGGAGGCLCADVPAPWQGPVALWLGDSNDVPPACSDLNPGLELELDGDTGLSWQPADCDTCDCDAANVTCSSIDLALYTDTQCNTVPCFDSNLSPDSCVPACGVGGILGLKYGSLPSVTGGSCTATPADPLIDKPPVGWANAGRVCSPTDLFPGCSGAELCLPDPGPGRDVHGPCVFQSGAMQPCPAGFDEQHVLYGGVNDTRACSACGCGGESCGMFALQFELGDVVCGGNVNTPAVAPDQCATLSDIQGGQNGVRWNAQPVCAPFGGAPIGGVTPTNATTFCCAP